MTTPTFHLADFIDAEGSGLEGKPLQLDASETSTQTLGAIAAKGGGKSYLAGKLAEGLHACGAPFVVLDPVGNWSALTLDANGKDPGLGVVVIGGDEADILLDLDGDQAQKMARFLLENGFSAVLDLSELSKTKRKGYVADFCESLYQKARSLRTPFFVVFEEAQLFAPQHAARGEERMLGAVTDIVRLGRNYGLGSMMLTQRPQSVSKEVLNQIECLFVGQLRGPQERRAIAGWLTEVGAPDREDGRLLAQEQLRALPALKPGEFFCWSPSWLRLFAKAKVAKKWTFDGSRTPELGQRGTRATRESRTRSDNVKVLLGLLAQAPEELRAEAGVPLASRDWKEAFEQENETAHQLKDERDEARRRVLQLEEQLRMRTAEVEELRGLVKTAALEVDQQVKYVVSQLLELGVTVKGYAAPQGAMVARKDWVSVTPASPEGHIPETRPELVEVLRTTTGERTWGLDEFWRGSENSKTVKPESWKANEDQPPVKRPPAPSGAPAKGADGRVLAVLAWHPGPCPVGRLALLAGYSAGGGAFRNILSRLRTAEWAEGSGELSITKAGRAAAGRVERPPTGRELFEWWTQHPKVDGPMGAQLRALRAACRPLTVGELAAGCEKLTGKPHSAMGGSFRNALSRLRTLGLVVGKRGEKLQLVEELRG